MFQTSDHAKILLPFSSSEESAWAYVELMVNTEWFFADCHIIEDDISFRTSYILSNPTQLHELIDSHNISIIGVYVVSPPDINNTDLWKMDQVTRVIRVVINEDNYQTEADIYELANGGKYYSSAAIKSYSNIENFRVLFSV